MMTDSPNSRSADWYMTMSRVYMMQADHELAREDYRQAGGKAWGAVSTSVKSFSEQRGWLHRHHRSVGNAIRELADEFGQEHLKHWFAMVEDLHDNFYEGDRTEAEVIAGIETAKNLLEALETLRREPPRDIPNRSNNQKRRWETLNGRPWRVEQ